MPDGTPTWIYTAVANTRAKAGDSSAFSTPPLMSDVATCNGINAAIAYLNRKQSQLNSATPLSYCSANTTLSAAWLTSVHTAINALRAYIGMSAFTFTATVVGHKMRALMLNELQTSQVYSVTLFQVSTANSKHWIGAAAIYPAYGASSYAAYTGQNIGKAATGGGNTQRRRYGMFWALPNIGTNATGTLTIKISVFTAGDTPAFVPALFTSDSDDSAFSGNWQFNLNNYIGTTVLGYGDQTFDISHAVLSGRTNANLSMVLGNNNELVNAGIRSNALFTLSTVSPLTLRIDY